MTGPQTLTSYRNSEARPPIMAGAPPAAEWRIPRGDWDRPPWNRWAFQNIRQILPTAPIRTAGQAEPWRSSPQDLTGIAFLGFDGRPMTLDGLLDDYTDGFLVALDGRVVHESYHNGMTPHTLHLAQSVSKSIVSTTAGCMIGTGRLDPGSPVTEYLPELAPTAWAGATLQHVLDMTTGVAYVEEYEDPNSDVGRTDVASGWKPAPAGADPADWPATLWDQILGLTRRDAEHGRRFKYRSIETEVLGLVIARVTGLTLAQAISHHLWVPIGAATEADITVDPAGTAVASGGISASLRDFARFGQTMLDDGRTGGRQVIPEAWIRDVRHGPHGRFDDQSREFMPNGRYRNMFWIRDADRPAHLSLGVFGQFIYVDPEKRLVVVHLSSWPEFLSEERHSNTIRAIDAIAAEIA